MLRLAALALGGIALAALLSACGGDDGNGEQAVEGIIISVEASTITEVDSFEFRTDGGETLTFSIAPEATRAGDEGFVASHLRSHAIAAEHTTVYYRVEDGQRLAIRLEHN